MSLRGRVIALVGLMLLVSLSIYVAISWTNAQRDLAAELGSARTGGLQTVQSAFEDLPRSDHPERDLRQLVATFNGNRHLSAAVIDRLGKVRMSSSAAMPRRSAPSWFAFLLRPDERPVAIAVPRPGGELLRLRPESASDVAALWSATLAAVAVFAVSAMGGLALVYWVIGRALAPLADLSSGLKAIGASDYQERLREQGPPELHSLQRGFNAMAERLADIHQQNRALEAQLLTIQDEERAEIARDLHDEIGPHLFAVALDAEMIGRSVSGGGTNSIPEQVQSIQAAVSYMQRQVRELIARLRPTRAAELGLEAAILDLVSFWQIRQPDVEFVAELDQVDAIVPDTLRDVIYRVVQESVANALKHAQTNYVAINVARNSKHIFATIVNRGISRSDDRKLPGLGLASMRERVNAAGGLLTIERSNAGWKVVAGFEDPSERRAA